MRKLLNTPLHKRVWGGIGNGKIDKTSEKSVRSNPKKQKRKVTSGSTTGEKRAPRKRHTCIFHKHEEQSDGTFICLICGRHFERKMDEAELRQYLYFKRDYSLKELREMDSHILEVIYGKDTRGVVFEFAARELSGRKQLISYLKSAGISNV